MLRDAPEWKYCRWRLERSHRARGRCGKRETWEMTRCPNLHLNLKVELVA